MTGASLWSSPAAAQLNSYPVARLKALDKITARINAFDVPVDETVSYGSLNITVRTCRKAPPIDPPRTVAFLEITEDKGEEGIKWVFSGWMFASSPALSSMDHAVYDVWVIDCVQQAAAKEGRNAEKKESQTDSGHNDSRPGSPEQDKSPHKDDMDILPPGRPSSEVIVP